MINSDNFDSKGYECEDGYSIKWYTPIERRKQYYKRRYNSHLYTELKSLIKAGYNAFEIENGSVVKMGKMR